jgi:hypothetical protein
MRLTLYAPYCSPPRFAVSPHRHSHPPDLLSLINRNTIDVNNAVIVTTDATLTTDKILALLTLKKNLIHSYRPPPPKGKCHASTTLRVLL